MAAACLGILLSLSATSGLAQDVSFTTYPGNPIISVAADRHLWNDPTVIKDGSNYVMYLTRNVTSPGVGAVVPYRATSTDGIHWNFGTTRLLSVGAAGQFDALGIETPSVVVFNGQYHMYYMGYNDATRGPGGIVHIGHATSSDGISWTKDAGPALSPSGRLSDWNGYQVAEPGAVVFNNRIYLYYTAVSVNTTVVPPIVTRTIGVAVSDNGSSFGKQKQVVTVSPAYSRAENYEGYSCLAVAVIQGQVHLFYDVFQYQPGVVPSDRLQVALHHAMSPDGLTGFEQDPWPFLVRGESSWNRREIRAPFVMQDGDTLKLWYAGDDLFSRDGIPNFSAPWGIGYAETALPDSGRAPHLTFFPARR